MVFIWIVSGVLYALACGWGLDVTLKYFGHDLPFTLDIILGVFTGGLSIIAGIIFYIIG